MGVTIMLSLQGIICKQLKNQGKLPEKYEDLACDPSVDPLIFEFLELTQKIRLTGFSSANDKISVPAGYYPVMTDLTWDTSSEYLIKTPPRFTGEYFHIASTLTLKGNYDNAYQVRAFYLRQNASGTLIIDSTYACKAGSNPIYNTKIPYSEYCYLGSYEYHVRTHRYGAWHPYYDLNQTSLLVDDSHKIAAS